MVAIPDRLRALVTAHLTEQDGTYHIKIPTELIEQESVEPNKRYQIAIIGSESAGSEDDHRATSSTSDDRPMSSTQKRPEPPVEEGEVRTVTIDTIGDQGDGITRVERGFVVIVAGAEPDEEVTIEIETVQPNVAFASVVE